MEVPKPADSNTELTEALPEGAFHNNYRLYVRDDADLIGLIAYSLYKQHKIGFLADELARTEKPATKDQVDTFCRLYASRYQVDLLRNQAQSLLEGINEDLLKQTAEEIREHYQGALVSELKKGPSFWKAIRDSVAGNIATAALAIVVLFGMAASDKGLIPAIIYMLSGEAKKPAP